MFCPKCGAKNQNGNAFCQMCGIAFQDFLSDAGKNRVDHKQNISTVSPGGVNPDHISSKKEGSINNATREKVLIIALLASALFIIVGIGTVIVKLSKRSESSGGTQDPPVENTTGEGYTCVLPPPETELEDYEMAIDLIDECKYEEALSVIEQSEHYNENADQYVRELLYYDTFALNTIYNYLRSNDELEGVKFESVGWYRENIPTSYGTICGDDERPAIIVKYEPKYGSKKACIFTKMINGEKSEDSYICFTGMEADMCIAAAEDKELDDAMAYTGGEGVIKLGDPGKTEKHHSISSVSLNERNGNEVVPVDVISRSGQIDESETEPSDASDSGENEKEADDNDIRLELYSNILKDYFATDKLMVNGKTYVELNEDDKAFADSNTFAIYDVDEDGSKELLVSISSVGSVAQKLLIIDADVSRREAYVQGELGTLAEYYHGCILIRVNHNQSHSDTFWPYIVYRYNSEIDQYEQVGEVSAEDTKFYELNKMPENFPYESDHDQNGIVYHIYDGMNEFDAGVAVDDDVYLEWRNRYIKSEEKLEPEFAVLTEDCEAVQELIGDQ